MQGRLAGIALLAALAGGFLLLSGFLVRPRGGSEVDVPLTVQKFAFSPARISVEAGDRVRVRVLAEDVTHGFQLLHFGVNAGAIKTGTTKVVEFTPDRPGEFPFYCSVRCSPLHMALMGTLVVEP
ncbi:MAG: cupredoxin domain-containing protein [Candidatus Rokubacteria bacterium]|nr:cupredoxin domain-containing protein [Candidatus Rokubacteria bacterium]